MLHPEAALLGAMVENRDRLVDGIADDSGAVPSVVGLLETMAKEFRSRKLSGRGVAHSASLERQLYSIPTTRRPTRQPTVSRPTPTVPASLYTPPLTAR